MRTFLFLKDFLSVRDLLEVDLVASTDAPAPRVNAIAPVTSIHRNASVGARGPACVLLAMRLPPEVMTRVANIVAVLLLRERGELGVAG